MQIPCAVARERFAETNQRGRPYIFELVHFRDPATGARIRTRGRALPDPVRRTAIPQTALLASM